MSDAKQARVVAMQQPTFMPWVGYFELIAKSDIFIILNNYQFSYQGFDQRNRLFVSRNRPAWVTVPIIKKESFKMPFCNVKINYKIPWNVKLWKSIEQNYRKSVYFGIIGPKLRRRLEQKWESLGEMNIALILDVMEHLGLKAEVLYSGNFLLNGKSSDLVAKTLRHVKATTYLCARGSFGYMHRDGVFPLRDVETLFQNHIPQSYPQVGSDQFVPYLSVYDALFNVGPEKTLELALKGTARWDSWKDIMNFVDIKKI